MKKQSNVAEVEPSKKPKTNSQITAKLLNSVQQVIAKQLSTGKMSISSIIKPLPKTKSSVSYNTNPEQHLGCIQQSLKALRASMEDQRRAEKEQEKALKLKAQELIDRMRREKKQHQTKVNEQAKQQGLHRRLYSDSAIMHLRQQLQQRIDAKRQQIELRVKAIEDRRAKRGDQIANQEEMYRQKRQQMRQKAKSSFKLPSLNQHYHSPLPRKNSLQGLQKQAGSVLRLAKMRQQNAVLKQFEQAYSQRIEGIIKNRLQGEQTENRQLSNRQKLIGNEFLKESLLKVHKNSNPSVSPSSLPKIQAHEAFINANAQLQTLKEKWSRILSKVRHREISKEQGLEILNSIERRLDKLDVAGVKERLRRKYEVFSGQLPLSASLEKSKDKQAHDVV